MDKFEQSGVGKETNDSYKTFCQNAIHYKEKENTFTKNYKGVTFSLVIVVSVIIFGSIAIENDQIENPQQRS